jgi:hypothetical protein
MRRVGLVGVLAAALAIAAATPASAQATKRGPGTWCGGTRWRLMTLSDSTRYVVYPNPVQTNIPAIAGLVAPRRIGASRGRLFGVGFEQQVWRMTVVIERYRLQSNGEIALELYDIPSSMYMNAYMPNPKCLSTTTLFRGQIVAARKSFTKACPAPTPAWQILGASVTLSGVGFWNPVKTTLGALGNGAELRPVTGLQIINGCGHFG